MQQKYFLGGVANFLPLITFRGLYLTYVTSDNTKMQMYICIYLHIGHRGHLKTSKSQ